MIIETLGLQTGSSIALLYVHLPHLHGLNDVSRHDTVISTVESTMRAVLRAQGMHGVVHPSSADDVLAFVCIPPDFAEGTLTRALEAELTPALEGLSQILPHAREHSLAQFVTEAHTSIEDVAESKLTLARLLKSVQMTAWGPDALNLTSERHLLDRALSMSAFEFHFQPIVDVRAGSVIAYEALCRGTLPNFRFPDQIFATAERFDRVWDLGHVLRDVAGEASSVLHASPQRGCMMFINVHPRDINDPTFERQVLDGPLAPHASSVVLELTERAAIVDYPGLRKLLSRLRSRGYRIAIDDLGSGYAGLTALAEIEPEFIKFDMGLVRDLHRRPVKQRLIERISGFAREMNATTISEGVETAEERDALLCCGSTLMQGYFFGRPAPEFAVLRPGDVVG